MEEEIYALLEDKFLRYRDLISVPVEDCGEPLVSLSDTLIESLNFDERMKKYTGDEIYVRAGLVSRLEHAQEILTRRLPDAVLQVFYGYRHLSIQQDFFEQQKKDVLCSCDLEMNEDELKERIHHFIAVPEVAGHPTGGAVDICILSHKGGQRLDMGTGLHAFEKNSYVFSPYISCAAWRNRQILRECMLEAGFAPFDGEWWHFSYGDREWALYYQKKAALYHQVVFEVDAS